MEVSVFGISLNEYGRTSRKSSKINRSKMIITILWHLHIVHICIRDVRRALGLSKMLTWISADKVRIFHDLFTLSSEGDEDGK